MPFLAVSFPVLVDATKISPVYAVAWTAQQSRNILRNRVSDGSFALVTPPAAAPTGTCNKCHLLRPGGDKRS